MKKVIIYVDSLNRGGAEHVSVTLAEYMVKHNVECVLLTERICENEYDVPNGVKRISINAGNNKYFNFIKNIFKLRSIIKRINADKLLIMDVPGCLLAIPATRGLSLKVIVSERNDPNHFSGKKLVAYISRRLMKYADGFVFQTKDAQEYYNDILENKGTIIANPLFTEKLPDIYLGEKKKNIVSVGRLDSQKNQKLLIDAFYEVNKKYPDFNLIIYGEGILRNELEQQIKFLGLEKKVELPGNISNVLDKIRDASIFVLSSNYEGMPNALIEAMALGIPCISTDCPCGGPKSLIENNINGLLFPVGNKEELVKQIFFYIENTSEAETIGARAINIRKKLDMNLICSQWYEYLDSI